MAHILNGFYNNHSYFIMACKKTWTTLFVEWFDYTYFCEPKSIVYLSDSILPNGLTIKSTAFQIAFG